MLLEAIESGVGLLTWMQDAYAYAESYDEAVGRYSSLHGGQHIVVHEDDKGLLVRPDVARRRLDSEAAAVIEPAIPGGTGTATGNPHRSQGLTRER